MRLDLAAHRSPANAVLVLALTLASCGLIAYCRLVLRLEVVSTHVAYLPIVVAGAWWGRRGLWVAIGLGVFVLGVKAVLPTGEHLGADVIRVLLFLTVGLAVGTLSDRDARSRRDLAAARDRLQVSEKLASMGQLAAAVAHEINNPLGTVLLCSHSLLKSAPKDDAGAEDLRLVAAEAARCRDIVRGLLDFARQSRVSLAPVEINDLLEEVRGITVGRAGAAGVNLTVEAAAGLSRPMLDQAQVRQLLVNLVDNAIDACRPGGTVRLCARCSPDARCVEMEVADDGRGIPEEDMARIFTPFFTTKQQGKGTGLGLAIAYGVVKMHRGEIWAEPNAGGGTRFRVHLPIRGEAGTGAGAATGPGAPL